MADVITENLTSHSEASGQAWFIVSPHSTGVLKVHFAIGTATVIYMTMNNGTDYVALNGGDVIPANTAFAFEIPASTNTQFGIKQTSGSPIQVIFFQVHEGAY